MRSKLALFVALVLGVVAIFGVHRYVKKVQDRADKQVEHTNILVAAGPIRAGTPLKPSMWKVAPYPKLSVTHDHILPRDDIKIVQQTINKNVERDEPLRWSYIRAPERKLGQRLLPGECAMAIPVNSVTGVAGNLRPGSHVDILGTFPLSGTGAGSGMRTRRVLADVRILAVDNRISEEQVSFRGGFAQQQRYSTVTLALTPDECILVAGAQGAGTLILVLRNPSEGIAAQEPQEITAANLLQEATRLNEKRKARLSGGSP